MTSLDWNWYLRPRKRIVVILFHRLYRVWFSGVQNDKPDHLDRHERAGITILPD